MKHMNLKLFSAGTISILMMFVPHQTLADSHSVRISSPSHNSSVITNSSSESTKDEKGLPDIYQGKDEKKQWYDGDFNGLDDD